MLAPVAELPDASEAPRVFQPSGRPIPVEWGEESVAQMTVGPRSLTAAAMPMRPANARSSARYSGVKRT